MSKANHGAQSEPKQGLSCEWRAEGERPDVQDNRSALYPFCDYAWQGVRAEAYKQEGNNFANIVRNVIIGGKGESCRFEVRYFEIAEGGFSSLEKHQHEHVVMCIRGRGQVFIEGKIYDLHFLDIAYIAPDAPHQFLNKEKEPFGFVCIVNRERDQPQELDGEAIIRIYREKTPLAFLQKPSLSASKSK